MSRTRGNKREEEEHKREEEERNRTAQPIKEKETYN